MSTQHGEGRQSDIASPAVHGFGISRSRLGWLRIRFEGGPSYPKMIETLEEMAGQYGHLVKRGERLSGAAWLRRIGQSGVWLSEHQIQAVGTLMERE